MGDWDLFAYAAARAAGKNVAPPPDEAEALTENVQSGNEVHCEVETAAQTTAVVETAAPPAVRMGLRPRDYQQLAFGFLCSLAPTGMAEHVAIRASKPLVAAAGFWRAEAGRKLGPVKSAAVVLYLDKALCFADCANRDELLSELAELRRRQEELEAVIRKCEPELAQSDDLFSEFRTWNYTASTNRSYHQVRRRIERILRDLNAGSRLERIRRAQVADLCYLAVPSGLLDPDDLPADWGVVELGPERTFTLRREAAVQSDVTPEGRGLLTVNIAQAAADAAKFASGVETSGGKVVYHAPPRRRRARLK